MAESKSKKPQKPKAPRRRPNNPPRSDMRDRAQILYCESREPLSIAKLRELLVADKTVKGKVPTRRTLESWSSKDGWPQARRDHFHRARQLILRDDTFTLAEEIRANLQLSRTGISMALDDIERHNWAAHKDQLDIPSHEQTPVMDITLALQALVRFGAESRKTLHDLALVKDNEPIDADIPEEILDRLAELGENPDPTGPPT